MTRIIRTFSSLELSETDDELTLDEEESHHLGRVLRGQVGSPVEVLDGRGSLANAEITKLDRRATRVRILGRKLISQPKPFFRMAVAMTKASRWEEMIRPLTELGVGCITPLVSERTEVRVSRDKEMSKLAKWRKLAIEACKQSGNPWLPEIEAPVRLEELFHDNQSSAYMASLRAHSIKPLAELDNQKERVLLIIGPEGGWVGGEEDLAVASGVNLFSLGPNVLRAETAALCALAVARVGFLD